MHYDVVSVCLLPDNRLHVVFEDGRRGTFDMSGYLELPLFAPLRSAEVFDCAFVDEGTVAWPGDIDISPERLWSDRVRDAAPSRPSAPVPRRTC